MVFLVFMMPFDHYGEQPSEVFTEKVHLYRD